MTPAWAQQHESLLRDCIVSPDVFDSMVERLCAFVMPYQHALETEADKRNMHFYLEGLLSHLDRKNAEEIAALVDVERLVMQAFIGRAHPMVSSPSIPAASPSAARIRWG